MNDIELTVITPMYNEEEFLRDNLNILLEELDKFKIKWELIIVNDGSTDNSEKIALEIVRHRSNCQVVSYESNKGRGKALREGFKNAKGKYIITTESDLSWGPDIVPKLYNALIEKKVDVVIASVYKKGGGLENVPPFRRYLSKYGNIILKWAFGNNITMVSGMTRGYKNKSIKKLYLEEDRKEIHLEILSKSIELGFKIEEIPATIKWKSDTKKLSLRKQLSITRFIRAHLLSMFNVGATKIFFSGGIITFLAGFFLAFTGLINKFLMFTDKPTPNLINYGLIFIVLSILFLFFLGISIQISKLYKMLVHIQSQLKTTKE